ncbi:hypothetical protein ACIA5G_41180 [Amycolatopsis sp. NPDC051758]|uniref:hypothetical protein n=1 Tax=Amycolatopsis sp. NPDC051758 TaxID=3363935 RepID=UPI0037B399C5
MTATSAGRATTISQPPSPNFVAVTTTAAIPVSSAPKPLSAALPCRPRGRSRRQCRTMPNCERVKPTKTPIANSGTRVFMSPSETMSRRQRSHPGRHRDGDVEHVVHDQRRARDQGRAAAEVGPADAVRAAAVRERGDHLPVGQRQDAEQQRDAQRHRHGEAEPGAARHGQHDDDGFGAVRHRRHRVQGQRRQAAHHGQPVPVGLFGGFRLPQGRC